MIFECMTVGILISQHLYPCEVPPVPVVRQEPQVQQTDALPNELSRRLREAFLAQVIHTSA